MENKIVVIIAGSTATGKTALALELAELYPFEIINVDSAQVYTDMDVGTAKPSRTILSQIPHHLIDIVNPEQSYSAGQFVRDCKKAIDDIHKRGKTPLLVGGTMLYINALLYGMHNLPKANMIERERINILAEQIGWLELHKQLAKIDPVSAAKIDCHDKQRISRALEIYADSGITPSQFYSQKKSGLEYNYVNIYLSAKSREELRVRIAKRWQSMLDSGLLDEIVTLKEKYQLHEELPSMRCVGYRQLWQYLQSCEGNNNVDIAYYNERAIIATAQLAKRQMTWINSLVNKNQQMPQENIKQLQIDYQLPLSNIINMAKIFITI